MGRFADGEVSIEVKDSVRGKEIFLIQPTCRPVNENLMELLLMVTTLRRSSSSKINVVIPYYGYARQDRKTGSRVPISAADVARLLETAGVDRVIVMDLHSGQSQGFFGPRVPCDNLEAQHVAMNYFKYQQTVDLNNAVVVSPDAGGVTRAKAFLELMQGSGHNSELAIIIKERSGAGKIGSMKLVGDVKGKHAIIIDDIIDTAGTLNEAAKKLREEGATSVHAFATHGLFSGKAIENIKDGSLDRIIVTNTIPKQQGESELGDKVIRLSVAPILAEAIYRIQSKKSVSSLFREVK